MMQLQTMAVIKDPPNKKTGWWLTYPSEKYKFVSWDDNIPTIWKVIKLMFQTTNQKILESMCFSNMSRRINLETES